VLSAFGRPRVTWAGTGIVVAGIGLTLGLAFV